VLLIGCTLLQRRLLASQLHGINSTDPSTFALASLLLVAALAACLAPALRATRIGFATALRSD